MHFSLLSMDIHERAQVCSPMLGVSENEHIYQCNEIIISFKWLKSDNWCFFAAKSSLH